MFSLRFTGDWNPWVGALAALLLAGLAWWIYRRETRTGGRRLAWLLPTLRTLAIFMAVILLIGPVLHHRKVIGKRGRVLVFLDASKSMKLTDEPMASARKLLAVHRLGLVSSKAVDTKLSEAADELARARRAAGGDAVDPEKLQEATKGFAEGVETAHGFLSKVDPETGGVAMERKGVILREVWTGVPGALVSDLTKHPKFKQRPDQTTTPQHFEAPVNWGESYGTRMRGFVHPPETGNYVFWISGDDQCELWLSKDADPSRRVKIAHVPSWTDTRKWDAHPQQQSRPVRLESGKKYYIEALQKENTAGDSVAVGWQLPNETVERPIPGSRLSSPTQAAESPAGALDSMISRFEEELLQPARALAAYDVTADRAGSIEKITGLIRAASRHERELRQAFANYANRVVASPDAQVQDALLKFDAMPRWKRVERLVLGGGRSLVSELAEKHHVELIALSGKDPEPIWGSGALEADDPEARAPRLLTLNPDAHLTNLSDGMKTRVGDRDDESVGIVLVSDGQHNDGSSPLQAAKLFGNRQIPVYTIGVGSSGLPEDLALLEIKAPSSVFHKDRVKGELILKDDMPPGRPFTVRVEHEGKVLWERTLATEQSHRRTVAFDFPIQKLVEQLTETKKDGVDVLNVPLALEAKVSAVAGEREKRNNSAQLNFHAIMHKRKCLVLDGRPRWEIRYLRNLFDRDEQWEINPLLATQASNADGWPRGDGPGKFPADRETLFSYDFIVFGEVPRQYFKMEELEWLRDFVGRRGGGMLVLDGRRGHVGNYAETALGALLPVDWKADPVGGRPSKLELTAAGAETAWLSFSGDKEKTREIWSTLRPPHSIVASKAHPGAEVLLEAVVGDRKVPALVTRRYGAGHVLYAGFDETWRWRYEVGDLYHSRYWNQVVRFLMERPFAVRSPRISLDTGKPVYEHGEAVAVRARLRDREGKPMAEAKAEAWILREGRKVASVTLEADENGGGIFHGRTDVLPGGTYHVRLNVDGMTDAETRAQTEFRVRPQEAGELAALNCNEELLRQISSQSGGVYFREEESHDLSTRLEPLSEEKIIESDTVLWQSWWWFVPLIGLLAIEWALRKWAGML